ncbi:MAG: P-loop NTPase fold protein [Bacteroidales bacterium]|nr:P-loop NTPase fold protein [Bacteroidales bacterium]
MKENDKKEYRNWYKRLLRIQKKELILFGVLILLAFIFVGISKKAYEGFKIIKIYDVLDKNPLINIPICIIISGFAIWWWTKIWKDKDIRPYRLGIIVFGLIVFIFIDGFLYANIVYNFSYKCFFICLLVISAIIILIRFYLSPYFTCNSLLKWYLSKNRFKRSRKIIKLKQIINPIIYKQDKEPELKGFSVDDTEIKLEDNQIKYAKTLVKKLKNTDLSKESFAVGITGEWGSGKSTFLNTMKKEIKKEDFAEIVEFNPWLCNSPEQVTQDFFATLINELSPKHSTLSRTINKYAKLLNKIAKPSLSIFGIDLDLTPGDDSLDELKENISKKLANLPKKVVILIDDTDRLEGNEIFEILRLIRNTADFKNVIYIATYDKEYVTDVLKENKIKDPDNYLEKIFQVEVPLPKIESYKLWDMLMREIGITEASNSNKQLILKILTNYRQIKRFARKYLLFVQYVNKQMDDYFDINRIDLFWLELLHTYDKKTYDILANNPLELLEDYNLTTFKLKDNFSENIQDEQTKNILHNMFRGGYRTNGEIQLIEFYDRYFSMNISKYKLTNKEYFDFIQYKIEESKEQISDKERIIYIENKITEWLFKDEKEISSIIYYFNNSGTRNNTTINYWKNVIYSLLSLIYISPSISINEIHFLNKDRWLINIDDIPQSYFKEKIKNCVSDEDYIKLSKSLNKLYTKEIYNINQIKDLLIISSNDIIEDLNKIIENYLNNNKDSVKIYDLISEDKPLSQIFKNCCVTNKVITKILGEITKKQRKFESFPSEQIALDTIIQFFNGKLSKDTLDDFILKCFNLEDKVQFFGTESLPSINKLKEIQTI